jgi:hypothetical protein
MENMSRKSKRSTLRELDSPAYEKKEPRVGTLPSIMAESEESLVLDPELHPRDYIHQVKGQNLIRSVN